MVAGRRYSGAGSGVETGLAVKLLKAIDETLDAILIGEQVASASISAAEDAADGGVEEEHTQAVQGASPAVGLQEEHGRYDRAAHGDLTSHGLDVVAVEGAKIS